MALIDNLISHWKLDEASGNALDAHGSNDLTDNNTVGSASGKLNGARDFESGSSEWFSIGDNTDLSTGDIDFAFAAWVQLESKPGGAINIVAKRGGSLEYAVRYDGATDRFDFFVTSDGTGGTLSLVRADNLGSPSTATWYFVMAWHDATANTINIQVNDGTVDSQSHSGGVFDGSNDFGMGAYSGGLEPWDGLIDSVSFWKRVLTSGERTQLYNSGAGLDYDDWDAGGGTAVPVFRRHYQLMQTR